MQAQTMIIAILSLVVAQSSWAEHQRTPERERAQEQTHVFYDYARVVKIDPIIRRVKMNLPRKDCWKEEREVHTRGNHAPQATIAGGIIGGALGHEVGRGEDRGLTTAMGTVIGAVVGHEMGKGQGRDKVKTITERHCREVSDTRHEEQVVGYEVHYRYNGEHYHTTMRSQPGPRIRVRVAITPED